LSPLAEAIYEILAVRANRRHSPMTYLELTKTLRSPHDGLAPNAPELSQALGEVGTACREHGMPTLTALVVRGADRNPGGGYYHMFHPEVGNDLARRREAWENELTALKSTDFPPSSHQLSEALRPQSPADHHGPRQLGALRVADGLQEPSIVFTGQLSCPLCSMSMEIKVLRNPNILSEKQPTFVIQLAKGNAGGDPLGCLFVGSILSSPVIYYGSFKHCDHDQRISVFFNRALRDRSDHHFVVLPAISKGAGSG
jgi:hypothetical protein